PALAGKPVVVLNGRPATAERVCTALARACARATVFAPEPGADLAAAARALAAGRPIDGIVDLGLEASFDLADADAWQAPMRRSIALLQACYGSWVREEDTSRLFYLPVTWMDGQMGHGEGTALPQPLGGLWAGLAKTLPQELPNCNVRVLDLAPDEAADVDRHVVSELYRWGLFEVGRRGGRRYTLKARQQALPADQRPALAPGDTVLFSGGGRGIGLLCARALAAAHGCTVVVTGREPLADGSEPWMQLDDDGFRLYGKQALLAATPERLPAVIRAELARMERRRALRKALDDMQAQGLQVHYRVCDITDAAAVRALCDEIGDALRLVVHNAGVDRPVRLAGKRADDFIDTVRTKVAGFAALAAAVAHRPRLLQFCNVGSLTGRWGGMTGETDYAAANEALARLGLWAQRGALPCCVKTLDWPTWDGVGMITNFAVTQRYVTPMALVDGVAHWLRELGDDRSGEVMFMGAVGRALTPVQIQGFSPILDLPNIDELVGRHHHCGQPQRFLPHARFVTDCRLDADLAPWTRGFRLQGEPALPVSMLVDYLLQVADWVPPETLRPMAPQALLQVSVQLHALACPQGLPALRTEARGGWVGDAWQVQLRCTAVDTGLELLSLVVESREAATGVPAALAVVPPAQG
ncbi:MAG: SDR family NAD(P)-dependent oxidoreductase, partial [Aquincola tertiaricarbonis]